MRAPALTACLATLAMGVVSGATPLRAQTYDPAYPVCLHVYGRLTYYECSYTSLAQCNLSASGRSALCDVNPYFAGAPKALFAKRHYRQRRVY